MEKVTCHGYAKIDIIDGECLETCFAVIKDGRIFESFPRVRTNSFFENRTWFKTVESVESVRAKAEFIGNYAQSTFGL